MFKLRMTDVTPKRIKFYNFLSTFLPNFLLLQLVLCRKMD